MPEDPAVPLPALVIGEGPALVLMHGFGLDPRTYDATTKALADRFRVIAPRWLEVPRWTAHRVVDGIEATLDDLGVERADVLAHSFGGGLAMQLAMRCTERIASLTFADTIGLSGRWRLVREAVPGFFLSRGRLFTRRAAVDFVSSALRHPVELARAGWWGFDCDQGEAVDVVAASDIARHVLWAERDALMSQEMGQRFAERIGASFHVVEDPGGKGPTDHDWVYRHPHLVRQQLDALGIGYRDAAPDADVG